MTQSAPSALAATIARRADRPRWFAIGLAAVLGILLVTVQPRHTGDVEEYALTTVALARHGTPDVRLDDVAAASALLPAFEAPFRTLADGMATGGEIPKPGYFRGHDGRVYAIHFFAYPALSALAFKALPLLGLPAFKCFLAVNLAFFFALGLALRRLFGDDDRRAAFGVLMFVLCGGFLYAQWSSPETMSAAALLAALALYLSGAPVAGGLVAGIAAMHNPPIVLFAAFAPLLRLAAGWQRGSGLVANLRRAIGPRELAGSVLAGVLFALPVLFNLWAFGVPSIIAKVSTAVELATPNRLFSFFFDLSQGMLIGVPALFLALLAWAWRGRNLALAVGTVLFSVALAAPSTVAHNWNSGSEGMMRYAFWGAMPLLFALFWRLRQLPRWPLALLAALVAIQVASIVHIRRYNPGDFSPLAKWVMAHAPGAYNPDPEIFHERNVHQETWLDPRQIDSYAVNGVVVKRMANRENTRAEAELCGPGRALGRGAAIVPADRNWYYLNGPFPCTAASTVTVGEPGVMLVAGWSGVEHGPGEWTGAWSNGQRARLSIQIEPGHRPSLLTLHGQYYAGNKRSRVSIDGVDLGWQALDQHPALQIPEGKSNATTLEVELQFDAPNTPAPGAADQRHIAFFLHQVNTR